MLRHVGLATPLVLATGGGTPCFHESLAWLLAHGTVMWLDVPLATIVGRLLTTPAAPPAAVIASRPLLAAAAAASPKATETMLLALLSQTLTAREPFYAQAPHRLRADNPTVAALRSQLGI